MKIFCAIPFYLLFCCTLVGAQKAPVQQTAMHIPDAAGNTAPAESNSAMKNVYLFSGLGADYRAFEYLELPGYNKIYIQWIPPLPHETMAAYAGRIRSQIKEEHPVLIGLSFGGMMAVEVAKQVPAEKVILISSAKTKADLMAGSSLFFKWKLYKIIPGSVLQQPNFVVNNLFGATSASDKQILAEILQDTDVHFFRWAMDNIVHWDNEVVPPHLIHIHGTADKIIPYAGLKPDYSIEGGGHLMILNKADTIGNIILDYLRH